MLSAHRRLVKERKSELEELVLEEFSKNKRKLVLA